MRRAQRPLIKMVAALCHRLNNAGKVFTLEHRSSSAAWKEEEWASLRQAVGVQAVGFDQCRFGATIIVMRRKRLVKKATRIIGNCDLSSLARKCNHGCGAHPKLKGRNCTRAAAYPVPLCNQLACTVEKHLSLR